MDNGGEVRLIKVGPQSRVVIGEVVKVRYQIESDFLPEELWFDIPKKFHNLIDDSCGAALVSLIVPAMKVGYSIDVKGSVSEKLYISCKRKLQAVLSSMFGYQKVNIKVSGSLLAERHQLNGVATGFSGGVDSFSIINDYYFSDDCPNNLRLTHLVFSNVGANGREDEEKLFLGRSRLARIAAEQIGLPLIVVNSNMDAFYQHDSSLFYAKNHSIRNAAVANLLSNGISVYRYASAFPYKVTKLFDVGGAAYADPALLPMLSSGKVDIVPDGGEYSRVDKIINICDLPVVRENLHVCVSHEREGNCSECHKCARTMIVLDLIGVLRAFKSVFDVGKYYHRRNSYLIHFLGGSDIFSKEIQGLYINNSGGERLGLIVLLRIKTSRFAISSKAFIKDIIRYIRHPARYID